MQNNRSYTLKKGPKTMGLMETVHGTTRHYVLGFNNAMVARKVQYFVAPEPVLRIVRGQSIDITQDVATLLDNNKPAASIIVDTASILYIPKMRKLPGGAYHPLNDGGFHMSVLRTPDLYMMPFEQNLGVILPSDLIREDDEEMVFECQLIEPCTHEGSFRATLRRGY